MTLLASLRHYWRTSLAVVLSAATTTAVLTGALVVGDSMRSSLRDLTLERLGRIDQALLSESFFRQELADELEADPGYASRFEAPVPAVLLRGSATAPESGRRAAQVQIQGVEEDFGGLFGQEIELGRAEGQPFPSVVLNRSLAAELAVSEGEDVLLALARPSDVPRESLMGSTDPADVVESLRVRVRGIVPDRGLGRFGLEPIQSVPLNAYVRLERLQRALDQPSRVNALLFTEREGSEREEEGSAIDAPLAEVVERSLRLEDLGLRLQVGPQEGVDTPADVVSLESREIVLRPAVVERLRSWIAGADAVESLAVSSYLANRTVVVGQEDRMLPYSTIAGMDLSAEGFGEVVWLEGEPGALADDEIVVNEWAAEDLDVEVGDLLRVEYWEVGDLEELSPRTVELRLRGIVGLEGLAADPALTPPFPGVHDADDMADWEPTFPVDLGLIGERDEEYWDRYRATPKLYVAPELAHRLWRSRFGVVSSIRLHSPATGPELAQRLREELPDVLDPVTAGLSTVPVKEEALRRSSGATDFGGLFLGFSMFLIASAVLLAALFFRLGVERRAAEIGLRLGVGFRPRAVRRVFLQEGLLLAAVGGVLGVGLALLYARAMIAGLGSRWAGALGLEAGAVEFLQLHTRPVSLAVGGLAAFLVTAFAIWRTVRRLERLSAVALLRGEVGGEEASKSRRSRAGKALVIFLPLTLLVVLASFFFDEALAAPLFFAAGGLLLVSGLATFSLLLRRRSELINAGGVRGRLAMARANASLYPGRSLLAVALVSAAAFVIVAVGAYGRQFGGEVREKGSGAGGFVVSARSSAPLFHDLGSEDGRFELGFSSRDSGVFEGREVFALREVPGDDVSCLNLYQPEKPRLLGVPSSFIERGGFAFSGVLEVEEPPPNPWTLLQRDFGENVVPAIGDLNSVQWILKSGLGEDVVVENEAGEEIRLRLVGLLHKSIFQSELLISEEDLLEHFPSRTGYRAFLFGARENAETAAVGPLVEALENRLDRFGFDATGTVEQLQAFQAVENTYLGTFQTLGGLGLLLGTLGLSVVLLRSVLERSAELALLRAVGYRRKSLGGLVVAENGLLLVAGLVLGAVAAVLAVAPHLLGGGAAVPWPSLAGTLALVLVVGLLASALAARAAMNIEVLSGLRSE